MDTNMFLKICGAIITLLFGVIIPFGIKFIKEKIGEVKFNQIVSWTRKAVEAAEMMFGEKMGEKKKEEVMQYVINIANNYNIKLTEQDIDRLIEAAVYEMKNN